MGVTLEVAGLRFNVGTPSMEVDRRLRAALAAHVVADDPQAPEAYVLALPAERRGLFTLHRFACPVVRARSAARLLDGLRHHVAADAGWHPAGLVPVRAVALRTDAGLVLLPDRVRRRVVPRSRRLVTAGVVPVDAPVVGLEPDSGHLVVPPAPLDVPEPALAAFAALGGDEPPQPAGRDVLLAINVPQGASDVAAVRALHLLALVADSAVDPGETVDAVLRAVEGAVGLPLSGTDLGDPDALLARLA